MMQEFIVEGPGSEYFTQWQRTSFVDDNGTVFIPAAIFDSERRILWCLLYDNIKMMYQNRHVYAPTWWLIKEYPQHTAAIEIIQDRLLQESAKLTASQTA